MRLSILLCVRQFYLLKLVTGSQRATGIKFVCISQWEKKRSIEFSIKVIVGKKLYIEIERRKDN